MSTFILLHPHSPHATHVIIISYLTWSIWTNEMTILMFLQWGIWAYAATIHMSVILLLIWGIWYKQWWLPLSLLSSWWFDAFAWHMQLWLSFLFWSLYLLLLIWVIWHMQWIWSFWLWSSILLFIYKLRLASALCSVSIHCLHTVLSTDPFELMHEKQYFR